MKFIALAFVALSLTAQDAPHVSIENRIAILQAQRDRADIILQANALVQQAQQRASQMVQQMQQHEATTIAGAEKEAGCKIDLKTVECEVKK